MVGQIQKLGRRRARGGRRSWPRLFCLGARKHSGVILVVERVARKKGIGVDVAVRPCTVVKEDEQVGEEQESHEGSELSEARCCDVDHRAISVRVGPWWFVSAVIEPDRRMMQGKEDTCIRAIWREPERNDSHQILREAPLPSAPGHLCTV